MSDDASTSSFMELIGNDEVQDALTAGAESVGDALLSSDALDAVPFVSTIRGLVSGGMALRRNFLDRKLVHFMLGLGRPSDDEFDRWRRRMESDRDAAETIDRLIAVLDHADAVLKARLAGVAFRKFLAGRCDGATMRRTIEMIDRAFVDDLAALVNLADVKDLDRDVHERLRQIGLVGGGVEVLGTGHSDPAVPTAEGSLLRP